MNILFIEISSFQGFMLGLCSTPWRLGEFPAVSLPRLGGDEKVRREQMKERGE
jgi:hypothetical protein